MKTRQLMLFLDVAKTGSIAEAARIHGASRTTVSAAVAALEDELGMPLFQRSGNRITLTPLGNSILPEAERITAASETIMRRAIQAMSGTEPVLRIARDDAIPERFWRDWLKDLRVRFPHTAISVYVVSTPELPSLVDENLADVAYGMVNGCEVSDNLTAPVLGNMDVYLVSSPEHNLSRLSYVSNTDLAQHTEITLSHLEPSLMPKRGEISEDYIALTFYEYIRDAAVDGLGWAKVPAVLMRKELQQAQLSVLRHGEARNQRSFHVIRPGNAAPGDVQSWLSTKVRQYLIDQVQC